MKDPEIEKEQPPIPECEPRTHRIVSVRKKSGCEYVFTWDDGYTAAYSAAVQCHYEERGDGSVSLSHDGQMVTFPDSTTMSSELLRVDTMQKVNRALTIMMCFAAMCTAVVLALLHWGAFAPDYKPVACICVALLASMSASVLYRAKWYAVAYIGLVLSVAGVAIIQPYIQVAALLLAIGYGIQILYLTYMNRRVSSGLES